MIGDDVADAMEALKVPGVIPLGVSRGISLRSTLETKSICFDTVSEAVDYILSKTSS